MDINDFVATHDLDEILIDLSLAQLGFDSPVLEDPRYADMNILQIIKIIDEATTKISSEETLKHPQYHNLISSKLAKKLKIKTDYARNRLYKFHKFQQIPEKIYPTNKTFIFGVFGIMLAGIGLASLSTIIFSFLGSSLVFIITSGLLFALSIFAIAKQHERIDNQQDEYDYSFKNLTYMKSRNKIMDSEELSSMTFSEMKEAAEEIDNGLYNKYAEEDVDKIEGNIIDKINLANDAKIEKILDSDIFDDLGDTRKMHHLRNSHIKRKTL